MIEAKRLAYEDLAKYYGDPEFAKTPMNELLSDAYAKQRRALIKMDRVNPNVGPGEASSCPATPPISPWPTRTA